LQIPFGESVEDGADELNICDAPSYCAFVYESAKSRDIEVHLTDPAGSVCTENSRAILEGYFQP